MLFIVGDPDRIRTCDRRFRKPLLYPAELRSRLLSFCMAERKSLQLLLLQALVRPECCAAKLKVIGIGLLVDAHRGHWSDGISNSVTSCVIFGFGLGREG